MTHAALVNAAVFWLLAMMTALLVMCLLAVILAPAHRPGSPALQGHQAAVPPAPLPSHRSPATPSPPLPRSQPPATAATAGRHGWPAAAGQTGELDAAHPVMTNLIGRPKVSGSPPWGPVPKRPGMDG
jgi:hypothetical protein